MATEILKFTKVTELPETFASNTVYLVTDTDADFAQFYISNLAGSAVRRLPTHSDVESIALEVAGALSHTVIVADITARNALTPEVATIALVIDATDDSTVELGAATYVYNPSNETWTKISEHESMDVIVNWSDIQGKPTSSAAAIDQAVQDSHTHGNKPQLDKVSEDVDGVVMYDADYIHPVLLAAEW